MRKHFIITLVLLTCACYCAAQQKETKGAYQPDGFYVLSDLKSDLDNRLRIVNRRSNNRKVEAAHEATSDKIVRLLKERAFIVDPEIESTMNGILKRLADASSVQYEPYQVLIMRSTSVNAISFGEGTFAVTTGMLSRITSEDMLAYLLAHELAHFELDHTRKQVLDDDQKRTTRKISKGFGKIKDAENSVTTSDIDSLKKWVYGRSHFSREREEEADSIGLIYLRNAHYRESAALDLLAALDSANNPRYRLNNLLEESFNSSRSPFRKEWLNPRLSLFEKQATKVLFFSLDSLSTHPDLGIRRKNLDCLLRNTETQTVSNGRNIFWNSDLENLESALYMKKFDEALLIALQTIPEQPFYSSYLKGTVGRILTDLLVLKGDPAFQSYVPLYTSGYSTDLRTVNTFLNNIQREELGELAWDYMNRKGNFDPTSEEHYFQLWRICNLTRRDEVKDKVKKAYREKFGKGKYYGDMDNPIPMPRIPRIFYPIN